MIDLTQLRESDKGRAVYLSMDGRIESGVIVSWNESRIFVRYWLDLLPWTRGPLSVPAATRPEDLEFVADIYRDFR